MPALPFLAVITALAVWGRKVHYPGSYLKTRVLTSRPTGGPDHKETGMTDEELLALAIAEAQVGLAEGGIPIGAALAHGDRLLGVGHNRRVQLGSAIRHGETDCLENAGRLPASVYAASTMATTLSPCDMCTGAILLYCVPRVVVGENRTFYGGEDYLRSRGVEVVVIDDDRCKVMMQDFIAANPELWHEDIGEPG